MFGTIRKAALLAIGGLLASAMVGAAAEPVEVTGESTCVPVGESAWSGEPVPGLPGSRQTNERGAWAGIISGTTTWSDTAPAHVHVIELDYLGAGEYEGLRFEGMIEGIDFPWTISGTIE